MAVTAARLPGVTFETRTPPVASPLPRMDIAGFVGFAAAGPVNVPVMVEEAKEFHDVFGEDLELALDDRTRTPVYAELPAAVRAFFRNGGVRCWIVRVAGKQASANTFVVPGLLTAAPSMPGVGAALAFARSPGCWSDPLLVNTTITKRPLPVATSSAPPGFTVGGLKPGDLLEIEYPSLGIVAFQTVDADRLRRPPLSIDVPKPSHWFRSAVRVDVDPSPPSPSSTFTWLAAPLAVRWLTGAAPDPVLPLARWGAGDSGFVVELDRSQLGGVQEGSWLLAELATAPSDAQPFLLLQVDRIQAAEKNGPASSPEPVWITTARAWWISNAAAAKAKVDGIHPSVSVVTFEMWARAPERDTARLAELGFTVDHPRYWGYVPDDEIVYRPDPRLPRRRERVSSELLADVQNPRFPLAAPAPPPAPSKPPIFLPLGITGLPRDDFYQPALPPVAGALERDDLTKFTPDLFLDGELCPDPERSPVRIPTLMSEAFQIQYVNHYGQDVGRALTGIHALLPVDDVSMIAVPDAVQRPWLPEATTVTPLGAPTLLEVTAREDTVHVEWTPVDGSPPEDDLTYTVQASLDPRFAVIAHTWTTEALTLDHDASIFAGCPTTVFYRVRATSRKRGIGPWSNALWDGVPPSAFERCPDDQPPAPEDVAVTEERGRLIVTWDPVAGEGVVFTLERASGADPEFAAASVVYRGAATRYEVLRGGEPVAYFRVAVEIDGRRSPWSVTVRAGVGQSVAYVTKPVAEWDADDVRGLLAVQAALMRMCTARGDAHAVLAVPQHFRDDHVLDHTARLGDALAGEEPRVMSYAAMFHPWVVVRETSGRPDRATWPIAPDGPVCGTIAARTLRNGAWYSPANQPLSGAVDLQPSLGDAVLRLLDARVNPIQQQPAGFVALDALTLYPGDELGELHVRRLLILLRRLAVREGAAMVFRPNDDSLRRLVQREFERVLGDLFVRGAFAGFSHDEGYRVVVDSGVNTPQSLEAGRFIVELRVAPSHPLMFLTVRLVHEGGALLALQGA